MEVEELKQEISENILEASEEYLDETDITPNTEANTCKDVDEKGKWLTQNL
jgi:hypothetical protein